MGLSVRLPLQGLGMIHLEIPVRRRQAAIVMM
jgi:hypothetical protein